MLGSQRHHSAVKTLTSPTSDLMPFADCEAPAIFYPDFLASEHFPIIRRQGFRKLKRASRRHSVNAILQAIDAQKLQADRLVSSLAQRDGGLLPTSNAFAGEASWRSFSIVPICESFQGVFDLSGQGFDVVRGQMRL